LHFGGVEYDSQKGTIDKRVAGLKVKFFNQPREDHHCFLNEAKLSAIAISIFFAALLLRPASRLRILALDDVLIGLDMSNRLPVLDILDNHFGEYQIFFFTYDKPWYDIVRQRVGEANWRHVEFYSARTDKHDLPVYAEVKNQLFLDAKLIQRIELCRSIVLNPISHASITNAFRKEIEDSIIVIEELETELKKAL
jgi:hypothetical protein